MQSKPLTNNLRECRKRAHLRQIDVAAMLGLDCADRLSRWENGSAMPNIVNLFKLAALYKVNPHELYPDLYDSAKAIKAQTALDSTSSVPSVLNL